MSHPLFHLHNFKWVQLKPHALLTTNFQWMTSGVSGEGIQIWIGWGCAPGDWKLIPILGYCDFSTKRYPFLDNFTKIVTHLGFWRKKNYFLKMFGVCYVLWKVGPCLGISCEKLTHFSETSPYVLICEYPYRVLYKDTGDWNKWIMHSTR